MELIRLTDRTALLRGPVNLGVILDRAGGRECLLVDSGLDGDTARRALRLLAEAGWRPVAVLTTHAHADHYGGNRTLEERAGVRVYCPAVEAAVLRDPLWEPIYLNAGAAPPAELRAKFFLAAPSPVDGVLVPGRPLPDGLDRWGVTVLDLAGHSRGMVGVAADGVLFAGDAFFDAEVVRRHGLPYLVDAGRALATLRGLGAWDGCLLVAAHGGAYRVPGESRPQVEFNAARIEAIAAAAASLLATPRDEAEVLAGLCATFAVRIPGPGLHYLYRATVAAYLTYLQEQGLARCAVDGARLLWSRA